MTTETVPDSTNSQEPPKEHQAPRLQDAVRVLSNIRESLSHHEVVDGRTLPPLMAYLSAWQSLRLTRTHADLLHDPEFSIACRFFLTDIYAPQDFSQRDHDGTRIYDFMHRFLPEATLVPLRLALDVNVITQQLDQALATIMVEQLGVRDRFQTWQYEEAYRLCDNYQERARQIDLIVATGTHLERVRRLPFISTTLRLAQGPAQRLGWDQMHDFLKRGFDAWKSLRRPQVFLNTIEARERAILDRIYRLPGGAPEHNPFLVSDGGPPEIHLP